jgi:hypothetical protein
MKIFDGPETRILNEQRITLLMCSSQGLVLWSSLCRASDNVCTPVLGGLFSALYPLCKNIQKASVTPMETVCCHSSSAD